MNTTNGPRRQPRRFAPLLSLIAVVAAMVAAVMLEASPRACGAVAEQNNIFAVLTPAEINKLIADLGDASADVRDAAQLQLANLPGSAYDAINKQYKSDEVSPEVHAALEQVIKPLSVRHAVRQEVQDGLKWLDHLAGSTYDTSGDKNPAWDLAAREALTSFEGAYLASGAQRIALFSRATDAGCNDPIIITHYIWWAMKKVPSAVAEPVSTQFRGAPRVPKPGLDIPQDFGDRLRGAVEMADRKAYPDYFRCFAHQTLAQLILVLGGDRDEARRHTDISFALLPGALKSTPRQFQLERAEQQVLLEAKLAPRAVVQAACDRVFETFSAASPGTVAPFVFKAQWCVLTAWDLYDGVINLEMPATREAEEGKLMALAEATVEAGCKIDSGNGALPVVMIDVAIIRGDPVEKMNEWFDKAMAADPDNGSACDRKGVYLAPSWHGSEAALLEFSQDCFRTQNFYGRIALMPIAAHELLARQRGAKGDYYNRAGAWESVRAANEAYLKLYPHSIRDREAYAKLAAATGHYAEAREQLELLGDDADVGVWGGQRGYDFFCLEVFKRSLRTFTSAEPAPKVSDEMVRALIAATDLNNGDVTALRTVAAEFPEIRVENTPGKAQWNRVTLNQAGLGLDCVRFRTPKGDPRDMRWSYIRARDQGIGWYIMPVQDRQMRGFTEYWYFKSEELGGTRGPGDGGQHQTIVQQLPAASLEPDTEYLLWFQCKSPDPWQMSVAITFVPPLDKMPEPQAALSDLGIRR